MSALHVLLLAIFLQLHGSRWGSIVLFLVYVAMRADELADRWRARMEVER
jgi:hypothetical protein